MIKFVSKSASYFVRSAECQSSFYAFVVVGGCLYTTLHGPDKSLLLLSKSALRSSSHVPCPLEHLFTTTKFFERSSSCRTAICVLSIPFEQHMRISDQKSFLSAVLLHFLDICSVIKYQCCCACPHFPQLCIRKHLFH